MPPSPSLASRAALAMALMAGFYALALGIAWGLAWIPYALWAHSDRLNVKIAFFCLAGTFLIVKAIVPRPDRFQPPGPRLLPAHHPRLFQSLESVAAATGQALPAEVYLVPDVNAWVAQRGGIMGFGSRPVMGLGLPLLQALTVTQMKAVLAHELGHYHGGDTRLGPWVYKTRSALGRTLHELSQHSSILQAPFRAYGILFLRLTQAVSRAQELAADALAARVVGAAPLAAGLQASHGAALAFEAYWSSELAPVIESGYLPPVAEGFARFVSSPAIARAMSESVADEMAAGRSDPYDTHPPLKERVAALARLPQGQAREDGTPALTLLGDVSDLEQRLLASVADEAKVQALKRLAWDQVGREVYLPRWRILAGEAAGVLRGWTAGSVPDHLGSPAELGRRIAASDPGELSDDDRRGLAEATVGAALAAALDGAGWLLDAPPGGAVAFEKGGARVEPFAMVRALIAGPLNAERWRHQCREAGIEDLALAPAAPA